MTLIPKEEPISNFVPSEGSPSADFVLVGEAPGDAEARLKRPFVGYSGGVLDDLLDNADILRRHCYLTTVIKEQPKNNNLSLFIRFKEYKGQETVELSDKAKEYIEQLKEELSKTTANIIIAVGDIALWALTGKTKVSRYRGSVLESNLLPGRKVLPILHPSITLRAGYTKGRDGRAISPYIKRLYILFDLMKAKVESEFPEIRRKERSLKVFPNYQEALAYLRDIEANCSIIGADIETNIVTREISHFSFAKSPTDAMSICFFKGGKNFYSIEEEANLWFKISKLMENPKITKVFQNGIFDFTYNFKRYGIKFEPLLDTMIATAIAFPDFNIGLDFLCSIHTDVPYYKDEGKDHSGARTDQEEIQYSEYSARDSAVLLDIMPALEEDLKKQKNWEYFLSFCSIVEPLIYMQERGVRVDISGIKSAKEEAQRKLRELEEKWKEETGTEFSLTSTKQLQSYFYIELGITPFKKRGKKDGVETSVDTLDEKALQRIAIGTKTRKPRPEAFTVLEHRKLSKLDTTYYDLADFDRDERMRCAYKPVGTRFSRLSSSENVFGTGMNMQNQPSSMKKYFLPDEGYMIFNMDLSQADWRIVAYLAMDYNMISTLESGKDIHRKTASGIFMCRPEDISDEPGSAPNFGNGTHSQRFWGKKANHSMNYDASAGELSLQLFIPQHQAKDLRAKYLSIYPGVANTFWEGTKKQIHHNRTITNLFGRSYTFRDKLSEVYKPAYSYIPQSTVADIINQWGIKRMYYDQDNFSDFELLLQVHDSIVFQVKVRDNFSEISQKIQLIKASLEQDLHYRNQTFSIPSDCEASASNLKDVVKLNFKEDLADQLEAIWKQQR